MPDYHMNGAYSGYHFTNYGAEITGGVPMSAIARPAETIMVAEMSGNFARYFISVSSSTFVSYTSEFEPHLEGGNIMFGDGHVKWLSLANMRAQTKTGTGNCTLTAPIESRHYCSKLWNAFRP